MTARGKHAPNTTLRRLREERGWSLRRVADELCLLAEAEDENRIPGVNANMVGVWERGWKRPSPFYQALFCQLYHCTASHLGFVHEETVPLAPQTEIQQEVAIKHLPQLALAHEQTRATDLLCHAPEASPEQQAGAWLTLGASGLSQLFHEGWTLDEILTSVQMVLQSIQAMPVINRRQLLQLSGAAVLNSIPVPVGERVSEEERARFTNALGQGIGASWKLFHGANIQQVLAIGQAQLCLVQQAHSLLYPGVRPLFYSAVYQLIGAAWYFSGHYHDAQKALDQSYITALQSANVWHMAQSLSWQVYVQHALEQHTDALQLANEAIRLTSRQQERETIRLRARLLALSAEITTVTGDIKSMEKRLNIAQSLLEHIPDQHEEFDSASWFQHAGTCALVQNQYETAITYLEHALGKLSPEWKYRYISTALPLAQAYTSTRQPDKALAIAQNIVPSLATTQAYLLQQKFRDYLQGDLLAQFPDDSQCQTFVAETCHQLSLA